MTFSVVPSELRLILRFQLAMAGFWSGGRFQYFIAIRRRYWIRFRALSRRLKRAETLRQREVALTRMSKLEAEFKEKKRNIDGLLF